jgi:hypothetical protein
VCWIGIFLSLLAVKPGMAQNTAQLTVNLNVQSSLQLVFQNNANVGSTGYCPLSNANTNSVGLNLGSAWILGIQSSPCAAYTLMGLFQYQVASAFDVVVTKANTSSPNYRLAAEISPAPPANVSWLVNNTALNNTSYTTLDASDNYSAIVTKTLQVQVNVVASPGTLQETVTFLATAN